jgi:type IV secretion system protein VirB5
MKRWRQTAYVISLFAISLQSPAGIPVVDASHIAQTILVYQKHVEEVKQLIEQVMTAKKQLDEAKKTLASLTGGRAMSTLVNMTGIRQALPTGFMELSDSIRSLGAQGASPKARAIYEAVKRYGCDKQFSRDADMQRLCEVQAYSAPSTLAMVQESVQRSQERANKLQQLLQAVDTSDAKAAADLHNRVLVETAMLTNEKILMDMALQSQRAQQELVTRQVQQEALRRLASGTGSSMFND